MMNVDIHLQTKIISFPLAHTVKGSLHSLRAVLGGGGGGGIFF
jgi:hypothetical protein